MNSELLLDDKTLLDEITIIYHARDRNMNSLIEKVFGGERAAKVRYSLSQRKIR